MIVLMVAAVMTTGCAWNNPEAELWRQRESGQISQQEYEDTLRNLREARSQGGVKYDEPPIAGIARDVTGGASSDEASENQHHHR